MGRAKAGHEFDASLNSSSTHDVNITLTSLCGFVDPTSVVAMEMVVGLVVAVVGSMCRSGSLLTTILNLYIQFYPQRCHGETCCYGCVVDTYGGETRLLITQTIQSIWPQGNF